MHPTHSYEHLGDELCQEDLGSALGGHVDTAAYSRMLEGSPGVGLQRYELTSPEGSLSRNSDVMHTWSSDKVNPWHTHGAPWALRAFAWEYPSQHHVPCPTVALHEVAHCIKPVPPRRLVADQEEGRAVAPCALRAQQD